VIGNLPSASETIREGPNGAGVLIAIVFDFLLLFVKQLVEIPESLEAFLAAEETRVEAEFNACWTLHGGRFFAVGVFADTDDRGLFCFLL
jgi:hypothetical protein